MKRTGYKANATKRTRTDSSQQYKRLKGVRLPSAIMALTHVLERIDSLLMPREEAVEEAIRTRDYAWFRQLRSEPKDEIVYDAILAAGDGDYNTATNLLEDLADHEMYNSGDHTNEWRVLEEAAANGHLKIVEYITEGLWDGVDREEWGYEEEAPEGKPEALLRAIYGGHYKVVNSLLDPYHFAWNLAEALEYALDQGQHNIAEVIYKSSFCFHEVAQRCIENREYMFGPCGDLLVQVASRGRVDVVKYVYNKRNYSVDVIECAFQHATECEKLGVVDFFLKTGKVPLKTVEKTFCDAAHSGLISTVRLLCSRLSPSPQLIKTAFGCAGSVSVVRYLSKKEFIPTALMIKAFRNACSNGHNAIVSFLCSTGCIPSEVITNTLMDTARHRRTNISYFMDNGEPGWSLNTRAMGTEADLDITKILSNEPCISHEVMTKCFEEAARSGHVGMVKYLSCNQQVSASKIPGLFKEAIDAKDFRTVLSLYDLPHISNEEKIRAFVAAARHGEPYDTRILEHKEDWPEKVLYQALSASKNTDTRQFLSERLKEKITGGYDIFRDDI